MRPAKPFSEAQGPLLRTGVSCTSSAARERPQQPRARGQILLQYQPVLLLFQDHLISSMASPCKASDFFFILISLLLLLPGVEALDLGDEVALLLGLAVSVTGLCACLGWFKTTLEDWMQILKFNCLEHLPPQCTKMDEATAGAVHPLRF
ncbi:hypothetical protein Y1Q_0019710 [Alligator mississippiensis]|uniref:Uncharacterized protein n=1 Tax=Alligator mississippiensis TaxID=8496 RepID=A0A151PEY6_ALLMI|nr:hypothetical protein Y1Q_0019710 [Alligator mississippiensis]